MPGESAGGRPPRVAGPWRVEGVEVAALGYADRTLVLATGSGRVGHVVQASRDKLGGTSWEVRAPPRPRRAAPQRPGGGEPADPPPVRRSGRCWGARRGGGRSSSSGHGGSRRGWRARATGRTCCCARARCRARARPCWTPSSGSWRPTRCGESFGAIFSPLKRGGVGRPPYAVCGGVRAHFFPGPLRRCLVRVVVVRYALVLVEMSSSTRRSAMTDFRMGQCSWAFMFRYRLNRASSFFSS